MSRADDSGGVPPRRDVSVVLCTYNGERFVRRQLTSILEQTVQPAEIVVGDDCSSDRTLDVVAAVASGTDVPVRVHRNPHRLGFADNFPSTARYAASPYIAFSDQDDDWYPDKIAAARAALDHHDAVLAVHRVEHMDGRGAPLAPPDRASRRELEHTSAEVLDPLTSAPWGNYLGFTMLFDRTLLDRFPADRRGLDPHAPGTTLSHDRWIYFLASTFGRTVVLPDVLARYRQHHGQLYGGTKPRTVLERLRGKLGAGRDQAEYLAGIAADRAALLESVIAPGIDTGPAVAAWLGVELTLRDRASLYRDRSLLHRLGRVRSRARSGVYSASAGGLGRGALVEDLAVAVALSVPRQVRREM